MAWWARACVWHPPYLWPTRTTGPPMASMAAFVYFWSSAYEVSGGCATDTLYPSFLRMLATASQPEPSANAPCTRTTFLIFVMVILLSSLSFNESCKSHEIDPRIKVGAPNLSTLAGFCRFCCFLSEDVKWPCPG